METKKYHPARGDVPAIIRNDADLYEGDLVRYFPVIFKNAQNVHYPFHNFRHMIHVTWLCHNACEYYRETMTKAEMRHLLIAALFHDFNHSGMLGDDDINIARAVRGLKTHICEEDEGSIDQIVPIIEATEYPYKVHSMLLPLSAQIIRDADLSQALNSTWIQQVVFGLAAEWQAKPIDVLRMQGKFLGSLDFTTAWAQKMFPTDMVDQKIEEAQELLDILEEPVSA